MSRIGFTGVAAPNRATLMWWKVVDSPDVPYLRIVLPCGNVREYLTRDNIPQRSVRCNCGEIDEEHWFVRYEEEAGA